MMGMSFSIGRRIFDVDFEAPVDLSVALQADGTRLSVFGMTPPVATYVIPGVADGGAVNCEEWRIIPHCHGTHTESVGHIARARIPVLSVLRDAIIPVTVITVTPQLAAQARESYNPPFGRDDMIISRADIEAALVQADADFLQGLIIRTLPNGVGKITRDYDAHPPAFFTNEAMAFIAALDVRHLLVDVPSVDRLQDEGLLSNHHIYWNVPQGTHDIDPAQASVRTITELIYVPDIVDDGSYIMNLQVAPLESDAAPSRPLLYRIKT